MASVPWEEATVRGGGLFKSAWRMGKSQYKKPRDKTPRLRSVPPYQGGVKIGSFEV
jgi:hypothetical protein